MRKYFEALPWDIKQTIKFYRYIKSKRRNPFTGVYKSFDYVDRTVGYAHPDWEEKAYMNAINAQKEIGKKIPQPISPSKWLLPVAASILYQSKKSLRILDFGGAGGLDYANLLAQTGGIDVEYHVVDLPEACHGGKRAWADSITFTSKLPDGLFDIVYSYAALVCADDYRKLLEKFASYQPTIMLFCKESVHEGRSFVRKKVNMGKGRESAEWVFDINELEGALRALDYRLVFRGWCDDIYNVDNYKPPYNIEHPANLLFIKNTVDAPALISDK